MLHTMYPALHYPLYKEVSCINGVNELADTLKFSATFYAETVGMCYGMAYLFSKWIIEDGMKLLKEY